MCLDPLGCIQPRRVEEEVAVLLVEVPLSVVPGISSSSSKASARGVEDEICMWTMAMVSSAQNGVIHICIIYIYIYI